MKITKKLLALLLTVLLVNTMVISAFASATPAVTDAYKGDVVEVEFSYENVGGIRGTFSLSGDNIIDKVEIQVKSDHSGRYNSSTGIIAYYDDAPSKFVCALKLTLSQNAKLGDECKIKFEYEATSDGKLPSVPNYSYDYATIKIVLNLEALNTQIGIAQALKEGDYTVDSWAVLKDALDKAIAARNATTQEAVDAATKALKDAIAGLKQKPAVVVDYTELEAQIAAAQALDESKYTVESWNVLKDALAKAIAARTSDSQAVVTAAAQTLKAAIAALKEKPVITPVDYTALQEQINIAKALKEEDYTVDSWNVLKTALANAENALSATTQAEVDAATKALKDAIAGLKQKPGVVVDYTELEKQIAIAQALDESKYTVESWNVLKDALAKAIQARTSDSQAVVTAAAEALKNAIDALVEKTVIVIDYTELKAQIEIAKELKEEDYTTETWEVLKKALEDAEKALTALSQNEVDAAAKALKEAIAGLKKKPGIVIDYSELEKQIAIAQGLKEEEYTPESWLTLKNALANAIEARKSEAQPAVDAAAKALRDAIAGLVKKSVSGPVDYSKLIALIEKVNGLDKNKYTEASWSRVQEAYDKASKLLNSASQAEVDAAALELENAINALEFKSIGGIGTEDTFIILPVFILVAALVVLLFVLRKKRAR